MGDTRHTGTFYVSTLRYCPTLQSVPSRSSCLLHPRQGTAGSSRSPPVRRPSRIFSAYDLEVRFVLRLREYPTTSQEWRRGHQLLVSGSVPASVLTYHPQLQQRSQVVERRASKGLSPSPCRHPFAWLSRAPRRHSQPFPDNLNKR